VLIFQMIYKTFSILAIWVLWKGNTCWLWISKKWEIFRCILKKIRLFFQLQPFKMTKMELFVALSAWSWKIRKTRKNSDMHWNSRKKTAHVSVFKVILQWSCF